MANTNIYVGNLTYGTTSQELEEMFSRYGEVARAQVVTDRDTGRSRGFGFVEMTSAEEAEKAIEALDGADAGGRKLTVNKARERNR